MKKFVKGLKLPYPNPCKNKSRNHKKFNDDLKKDVFVEGRINIAQDH